MHKGRRAQSKNKGSLSSAPTGSLSSAVVFMAPVLFALIIGCILLFLINIAVLDQEALGRLLKPVQWPLSIFVYALLMILLVLINILFLITPALAAFMINLKRPTLTDWSRAILSAAVFFLFYIIAISVAIYYHYKALGTELAQYNSIVLYALLFGVILSLSVMLFGRLGASLGIRRRERRQPDS